MKIYILAEKIMEYSQNKVKYSDALQEARLYYEKKPFRFTDLWTHGHDDLAARNFANRLTAKLQ